MTLGLSQHAIHVKLTDIVGGCARHNLGKNQDANLAKLTAAAKLMSDMSWIRPKTQDQGKSYARCGLGMSQGVYHSGQNHR